MVSLDLDLCKTIHLCMRNGCDRAASEFLLSLSSRSFWRMSLTSFPVTNPNIYVYLLRLINRKICKRCSDSLGLKRICFRLSQ
jgi:hypothetical protein